MFSSNLSLRLVLVSLSVCYDICRREKHSKLLSRLAPPCLQRLLNCANVKIFVILVPIPIAPCFASFLRVQQRHRPQPNEAYTGRSSLCHILDT